MEIDENSVLGLDVGIASCGVAWIRGADSAEDVTLLLSRCFPAPETIDKRGMPQTNNAERRRFRLSRRTTERKARRMAVLRRYFVRIGLLASEDPAALHNRKREAAKQLDPWALRKEGLSRALTSEEWAVLLIHIAKHRGYKSNSKRANRSNDEEKEERGKINKALKVNQSLFKDYRTVGEAIASGALPDGRKRNKAGDYVAMVDRGDNEREIALLFDKQASFRNPHAASEILEAYRRIAFHQRPLKGSADKVGDCPFETAASGVPLKRAARHSLSFELFRLRSRLANMDIVGTDGVLRRLASEERNAVIGDFGKSQSVTFKTVRERLAKIGTEISSFDGVPADKEDRDLAGSKPAAYGTYTLRQILGEALWRQAVAAPEVLDEVAFQVTFREDDAEVSKALEAIALDPLARDAVLKAFREDVFSEFTKAGSLSAKAARRIAEAMQGDIDDPAQPRGRRGRVYSEACDFVGYEHAKARKVDLTQIRNAVVRKSVREAVKQIKAAIASPEGGNGKLPGKIHIEVARQLGKSAEDRQKLKDGMEERAEERAKHRKEFMELTKSSSCSDEDLLRFELWKQQKYRCLYSDKEISPSHLAASDNMVQIDHILPYSRSGDNSFNNLVLCYTTENQNKKNQTPWEWMEDDPARWEKFEARVNTLRMKGYKKRNLLTRTFKEREQKFLERNRTDTAYVARLMLGIVGAMYPEGEGKRRVFARPGPLTSLLRKSWGVESLKKDKDGKRLADDRHHALDALVVGLCGEGTLQNVTLAYQAAQKAGHSRWVPSVPTPWKRFRETVEEKLNGVFVSRPERHWRQGALHDANLRRMEEVDGERRLVQRVPIAKLKIEDLDRIKDPERNRAVVEAVRKWLEAKKPKDAMPMQPKGAGSEAPKPIKSVTLVGKPKTLVDTGHGLAENTDMARVDVFRSKDKGTYHLIPIYPMQIMDKDRFPEIPNRAVVGDSSEDDWTPMDAEYEFVFSLHRNSYVDAVRKGKDIEGYFRSFDRNTGSLIISPHHTFVKDHVKKGIGTRNLKNLRKFHVDRLGKKHPHGPEYRIWRGKVCT